MSVEIKMPRLSDTMDEGKIVEWKVKPGDHVEEGDLLCVIETDKADVEFQSFYAGTLSEIRVADGESAPLGAVIAILQEAGEKRDTGERAETGGGEREAEPARPVPETERPEAAPAETEREKAPAPPEAKRPPAPAREAGERVSASPLARRLAEEHGIALGEIEGTGPQGRVVKADVEQAISRGGARSAGTPAAPRRTAPAAEEPFASPSREEMGELQPLSPMRRTIAKRMEESWRNAPHFTLTMRVDMTHADEFRRALPQEQAGVKISLNDLIVAAAARALREFPQVNASYEEGKVRMLRDVNVGVAVAMEEGLVTPVIRKADGKRLGEIAAEARDLGNRGRARKLRPEEYRGGSFTVSNLGMLGVEEFAAIMNPPEGAILAVGAVTETPVVREGQIRTAKLMKMTLSCDHRIIDGATGARFLGRVREFLENPALLTV